MPPLRQYIRDAAAVAVVALYIFPLLWWALHSFKPASAMFDKDRVVWFDFEPTLENYAVTFMGGGPTFFAAQNALRDSLVVATSATLLTLLASLPAAYALSAQRFRFRRSALYWVFFQRAAPPIAAIIPLVLLSRATGLFDTKAAVILAHAALNLPFAVLLLKSFFDDVPPSIGEAAIIDGATPLQAFWRVQLPMVRSGIAATAVLCFIFSWTEFLMSLFLTSTIRLVPVQLSLVATYTWGFTAAVSTVAAIPSFVFILLVQKYLVRGLTMGLEKA